MEKIATIKGVYVGSILHHAPCYTEFLLSVNSCVLNSPRPKTWNFSSQPPVISVMIDDETKMNINDLIAITQGDLISLSVVSDENGFAARDVKLLKRGAKTLSNFMEDILKVK